VVNQDEYINSDCSSDHSIRYRRFPTGALMVLTLFLQGISRYRGWNVSGSRSWPF